MSVPYANPNGFDQAMIEALGKGFCRELDKQLDSNSYAYTFGPAIDIHLVYVMLTDLYRDLLVKQLTGFQVNWEGYYHMKQFLIDTFPSAVSWHYKMAALTIVPAKMDDLILDVDDIEPRLGQMAATLIEIEQNTNP